MIDPEDASPVHAGVRELREETGFAGDHARLLGGHLSEPRHHEQHLLHRFSGELPVRTPVRV